jgi:hypothetical protein
MTNKKGLHLILRLAVVVAMLLVTSVIFVQPAAAYSAIAQISFPTPLDSVSNDGTDTEFFWWKVIFSSTPVKITHEIKDPLGNTIGDIDTWYAGSPQFPGNSPVFNPEDNPLGAHQGDINPSVNPPWQTFAHSWLVPAGAIPGTYHSIVSVYSNNGLDSSSDISFLVNQPPSDIITPFGIVSFSTSAGSIEDLTTDAGGGPTLPDGYSFPFGFFSFNITGLSTEFPQTVDVTIKLPSSEPTITDYWKSPDGGYMIPDEKFYNDGFNVITLTLTDGGIGDADGWNNGTIDDPGGPAIFATNTYTITPNTGAGGSISPSTVLTVNDGGSQLFTIIPNPGYCVADVMVDGSSFGVVSSYFFDNVQANHTIVCSFEVTFDSLSNIVQQLVPDRGIGNSLLVKLKAARVAEAKGNVRARDGKISAFINEVEAQSGKKISVENAAIMIDLAESLRP